MTEELQGGTAPDTEATASVATEAPQEPVAAIAVADEPAPTADDPTADVATDASVADPTTELAPSSDESSAASVAEATAIDEASPAGVSPVVAADSVESTSETPASDEPAPAPLAAAPAETLDAAPAETPAAEPAEMPAASLEDVDTADAPAAAEEPEPAPPPRELGPEPTTMEELLAEQDSDIKSFKHGDVVEGNVVRIDKDEILVDIGAKSEGVVSNRELYGRHAESQP